MGQLTAPNGKRIIGTSDVIRVTANVTDWTKDLKPTFFGGSDIYWDTQKTRTTKSGNLIVVDEDGGEHPINQCTYSDEEDMSDEEADAL
ncbi:MAG: hypothetical protein ACTHJR_12295 [Sphingomonas sp.]|uniref:hypothetical protein n=1 Tax=Sphingomonas sp. TaxID=28214 RepID=UPI003F7E5FE8